MTALDVTEPKKVRMLEALVATFGNITQACGVAEVSRQSHYNWTDKEGKYYDPAYDHACNNLDFPAIRADYIRQKLLGQVGTNPAITIYAHKIYTPEGREAETKNLNIKHEAFKNVEAVREALTQEQIIAQSQKFLDDLRKPESETPEKDA